MLLCMIFFLSGASALVFEMLWFQLAGLSFGSSVWAASLVLASFMGGLALGNGPMAWKGGRVGRPLVFYAAAEAVIGATGLGLVLLFPIVSGLLAPLFSPFLDRPILLNVLRAVVAVGLMIVPATASRPSGLTARLMTITGAAAGVSLGSGAAPAGWLAIRNCSGSTKFACTASKTSPGQYPGLVARISVYEMSKLK